MALNCCNWNDKQLDELVDMLKSADYSQVATFIANNFLCSGSRVITDDSSSTLRATVGTDKKTIVLSSGVFVHASKCSQLDTNQIINILNTTTGSWGTGQDGGAFNRYDIICVKNAEQAHTVADRWFVNDSVVPNTYAQQSANTLLNKAYYDIVVVHGTTPGVVPAAPTGYWAIAEIYVPIGCIALNGVGVVINDTTGTSNSIVGPEAGGKNWVATTRVLRMEFWSTKFNVDHDPATGYHRTEGQGGWHIGSDMVRVTATELNQALDGIGATVTAARLTQLTNGTNVGSMHLHNAGSSNIIYGINRVFTHGSPSHCRVSLVLPAGNWVVRGDVNGSFSINWSEESPVRFYLNGVLQETWVIPLEGSRLYSAFAQTTIVGPLTVVVETVGGGVYSTCMVMGTAWLLS
jgi:hypothetical protein